MICQGPARNLGALNPLPVRQRIPRPSHWPRPPLAVKQYKHLRYPDESVTLCIAAKCAIFPYPERDASGQPRHVSFGALSPSIVMCSDSMISTEWTGAEHGYKIADLPHNFMALTAGPVDRIKELVDLYRKSMTEVTPFTKADALECFRKPFGEMKRRFAEAHLQARLGIGYDEFRREGQNQLPPDLFSELFRDIHGFTSGVELIIMGHFGDPHLVGQVLLDPAHGPAIYRVSGDTVSEVDHFACIGAGAVIAESSLYYREQGAHNSLDETLYAVYEAKRLGEKAPGVGKKTTMGILQWSRTHGFTMLVLLGTEKFESHFIRLSPQKIYFDEPLLTDDDFIDMGAAFREAAIRQKKRREKR